MSSILVTSIHSSHLMSYGDYKPQNAFQLTSWCVAMVKGSLVECQPFPFFEGQPFPLPCSWHLLADVSDPCTFHLELHSITVLSMDLPIEWPPSQSTCRFTHTWVALAWIAVSQTCLCISSSPQPLLGHEHLLFLLFPQWFCPEWTSQFCIQLQCDSAQGICGCIVLSLVVFNDTGESPPTWGSDSTQWCLVASKVGVVMM